MSDFCPFRACCCLLLAAATAKPGRSTLDSKKGYQTKTGSTSWLTINLTLSPTLTPSFFLAPLCLQSSALGVRAS